MSARVPSEAMPEGITLSATDGRGWNPTDAMRLNLTPGFSAQIAQLAHDLVRAQVAESLRLARSDLDRAARQHLDSLARVASLEAALAELDGAP